MGVYRKSRNIEASIIDYLTTNLDADWTSPTVSVVKTFKRISAGNLPVVCVRLSNSIHTRAELGASSTYRTVLVLIDIFAKSDGQRLDLKDYLVEKLRSGLVYYDYVVVNGSVQSKTENGRLRILTVEDTPLDFNIDKDDLAVIDRYRHLLTLTIDLGKIEV